MKKFSLAEQERAELISCHRRCRDINSAFADDLQQTINDHFQCLKSVS